MLWARRVLRFCVRSLRWCWFDHHVIVAIGSSTFWRETAQGAHVGDELPDLLRRHLWFPRRHPLGGPFRDAGEDLLRRASIDPLVVHERRPHAAAAVRMT